MEEHNWSVVENMVLVLGLVTGGRKNYNRNNNNNNNNNYNNNNNNNYNNHN